MVATDSTANLPIDIHCGKLLEWLLSRRHCNKDWQSSSMKIRELIAKSIQDMPEHPTVTEMLTGTYITYSHCRRIIDVLKETEASSRNVFGRYSSQRMKDWQEICALYEKDNLYLAEMAQLLQQFVQYEIPSCRKQVAKSQQSEQECERKEIEYEKLSKEAERQYELECRQMHLNLGGGDSSTSVRVALLRSAEKLPEQFDEISAAIKSNLNESVAYYREFLAASRGKIDGKSKSDGDERAVPTLSFVLEKGLNATVYEYKYGKAPSKIERVSLINLIQEEENQEANETIDFDVVADIDGADIDFGIEAVDSGLSTTDGEQNVEIGGGTAVKSESIARGDEALHIFEHRPTMQKLVTDLRELRVFYKIRAVEVRREESGQDVVGSLLAAASSASRGDDQLERLKNAKSNLGALESDLRHIDEILKRLDDPNSKSLAKIRVSPEYLQSVADKVTEPRRRADKFRQSIVLMKEQLEETKRQAHGAQERAVILTTRAKELQKFLEGEISKKYQNRPVNIVGSMTGV